MLTNGRLNHAAPLRIGRVGHSRCQGRRPEIARPVITATTRRIRIGIPASGASTTSWDLSRSPAARNHNRHPYSCVRERRQDLVFVWVQVAGRERVTTDSPPSHNPPVLRWRRGIGSGKLVTVRRRRQHRIPRARSQVRRASNGIPHSRTGPVTTPACPYRRTRAAQADRRHDSGRSASGSRRCSVAERRIGAAGDVYHQRAVCRLVTVRVRQERRQAHRGGSATRLDRHRAVRRCQLTVMPAPLTMGRRGEQRVNPVVELLARLLGGDLHRRRERRVDQRPQRRFRQYRHVVMPSRPRANRPSPSLSQHRTRAGSPACR